MAAPGKEIYDSKRLRFWLEKQPPEVAQVLATRIALRVLPLVLTVYNVDDKQLSREHKGVLTGFAFRANFKTWIVGTYTTQSIITTVQAAYDAYAADAGVAARAANATAAAAARASDAADAAFDAAVEAAVAATRASDAATAATRASTTAATTAKVSDRLWNSINADIRFLEGDMPDALLRQPLWQGVIEGLDETGLIPDWAESALAGAEKLPQFVADGTTGKWGLWIAWYRALLEEPAGSYFGKKKDIELATQDEKFWEGDPDEVMERIAELVGWPKGSTKLREKVTDQYDGPTTEDRFQRYPFAEALVTRIENVLAEDREDGFAVHLHAPWGAGKTSTINMMTEIMEGKEDQPWAVVHFNAWNQQRRNPPWWPLIEAVKDGCLKATGHAPLSDGRWWKLPRRFAVGCDSPINRAWWRWRLMTDYLHYVVAGVAFLIIAWLLLSSGTSEPAATSGGAGGTVKTPDFSVWLSNILKVVAAAAAAFGPLLLAGRSLIFGSQANQRFYQDLSSDPVERIRNLFRKIVKSTDRPVCIFIDDLDRCDADYVVELLEGVQTIFRRQNVVYVVAADRSWIRASFEKRFDTFDGYVGTAGKPLGYLFLEKIFQISTPLPGISQELKDQFVNSDLLGQADLVDESHDEPAAVEEARAAIRDQFKGDFKRDDAAAFLEEEQTPARRAAIVEELAKSEAAQQEAEHLLSGYLEHFPETPRSMKLLINSFGMWQAIGYLQGEQIPANHLVRWTIIEQRYPALADMIVAHPERLDALRAGAEPSAENDNLDEALKPFLELPALVTLLTKDEAESFDTAAFRKLIGGSSR